MANIQVNIEGQSPIFFPEGTDPAVIDMVVKRDFVKKPAAQPQGGIVDWSAGVSTPELQAEPDRDLNEAIAGIGTGMVSWIPAGLSMFNVGNIGGEKGFDWDRRNLTQRADDALAIQEALTVKPTTKAAEGLMRDATYPLGWLAEKGKEGQEHYSGLADQLTEQARTETNPEKKRSLLAQADAYRFIGAGSQVAGEAAPFALPLAAKPFKAMGRGVKSLRDSVRELDQLRGVVGEEPTARPTTSAKNTFNEFFGKPTESTPAAQVVEETSTQTGMMGGELYPEKPRLPMDQIREEMGLQKTQEDITRLVGEKQTRDAATTEQMRNALAELESRGRADTIEQEQARMRGMADQFKSGIENQGEGLSKNSGEAIYGKEGTWDSGRYSESIKKRVDEFYKNNKVQMMAGVAGFDEEGNMTPELALAGIGLGLLARGGIGSLSKSWKTKVAAANMKLKPSERVPETTLNNFFDSSENVRKTMLDGNIGEKAALDAEGKPLYSPLKPNAFEHGLDMSKTQGVSVDITSICPKRLGLEKAIETRQLEAKRFLSVDELLQLRKDMKANGEEVACGACYVGRWRIGDAIDPIMKAHPELPPELFLTRTGRDHLKANYPKVFTEMNKRTGAMGIKGMETYAEIDGQILNMNQRSVDAFNNARGLRFQSWSDMQVPHVLDLMQAVAEAATRGLNTYAYTKVPDFVRLMKNTGMKINQSLMPKGSGLKNGKLVFDDVEGMPFREAKKGRDLNPDTIGNELMGVNDEQIIAALRSPDIDGVIPFHKPSMFGEKQIKEYIDPNWKDYTKTQNENLKPERAKEFENLDVKQRKIKKDELRAQVDWYRISQDFAPDTDPRVIAKEYLRRCEELGLEPKFSKFSGEEGYYKLLIDMKQFNHKTGKRAPQGRTQVNFDEADIQRMLGEYIEKERPWYEKQQAGEDYTGSTKRGTKWYEKRQADFGSVQLNANPVGNILEGIKKSLDDLTLFGDKPATETMGHFLQRSIQNKMLPLRDFVNLAKEKYQKNIPHDADPYFAEERMHGRVSYIMETFDKNVREPFVEALSKSGVTLDELDLYLKAVDAPSRNKVIFERNLDRTMNAKSPDEAARYAALGSGIDDFQAIAIQHKFKQEGKTPALEQLAEAVRGIQDYKLNVLEKFGLESPEMIQKMKDTFGDTYIPWKGKEGVESLAGTGRGFDIRSSGLKSAMGRTSGAENSVVHTFADLEATVVRAHKNEVMQNFLKFVEDNPMEGVEVNKIKLDQRFNKETGQVENINKPIWENEKDVVGVIRDGQHYYIRMEGHPLLAEALKGMTPEKSKMFFQAMGAATRFYSAMVTKYSPNFAMTNPFRDFLDAVHGLAVEQKASMAKDMASYIPGAARSFWNEFRGGTIDPTWEPFIREFRSAGGESGFYSGKNYEQNLKALERELRMESATGVKGGAYRAGKAAMDFVSDFTGAGENATRLAVYRTMREAGKSVAESASYAKNITLNFNRRGNWNSISQLYMFANPGIQGIVRFKDMINSAKGRYIMGGVFATLLGVHEANRALSGVDTDGVSFYDKISAQDKARNLIFMIPGREQPIKIPLGFYHRLPSAMALSMSEMFHGNDNPGKSMMNVMDAALDAFNPIGGSNVTTSAVPSVFKPVAEVGLNKDWKGAPVYPEYNDDRPDSQKAFGTVSPIAKKIAESVNRATGGDEAKPGMVDVSPETIEHLTKFYTGAPGATAYQLFSLGAKFLDSTQPFSGENLRQFAENTHPTEVPIVGRYYGAKTEHYNSGRFYELAKEAQQEKKSLKLRGEDNLPHNQDIMRAAEGVAGRKRELSDIRKEELSIKMDASLTPEERKEKVKELNNRKQEIFKGFAKEYIDAKRTSKAPQPEYY